MAGKQTNKAISITKLLNMKFVTIEWKDEDKEWRDAIGVPEMTGVWFFWGQSGNGKTTGNLKLSKVLTKYTNKVAYNTLEEGARMSMQYAIKREGIKDVARKYELLDRESFEELKERLRKRKSANVVFIDSFQYIGFTKKQYIDFKEEFAKTKLIIFISHAEGSQPEGKVAKFARYDADVKGYYEGHKLFISSRYGGGKDVVISAERAEKYWGDVYPKTKWHPKQLANAEQ